MLIHRKRQFFESAATISAILTCFVLPFASSLLSLFSILTLIFWLLSGKFKEFYDAIKTNPVALYSLLLMILFVVGILYSPADISESLNGLKKYRELIFIPILISLLRKNRGAQKNCEYSFICGCTILMLTSYLMYLSIIPMAKYGYSLVHHITHSYFMAILAYWSLQKSIDSRKNRYWWILIFLLSTVNLFYIAPGRTGAFVFLPLMLLFLVQRLTLVQQLIGVLLLTMLISLSIFTSDIFASRVRLALQDVQKYQYGSSRSSLGMRFDWWVDSVQLIEESPFIGHGTGSFRKIHDELIANTKIMPTDNPHNEYLFIAVQLGLLGLSVFLLIFYAQIKYSLKISKPDRFFAQGVVAAMIIGCLMNSFLFDSHQGHFWAFLSGVYFSSYPGET